MMEQQYTVLLMFKKMVRMLFAEEESLRLILLLKWHKYDFHDDSFHVWKKSLPTKIFSSFALTAQPHFNYLAFET